MVVNTRIESASISDRGLSDKRPQNEDSFLEIPDRGIFAVADGVGGAQAGEVASQMAVEILGEAFTNMSASEDAEDVMRIALERGNGAIYQMSSELSQLSKMATTIVALHLNGNIATIGHVGDSRLYRLDKNGDLFRETDDHSMVAEEVRAGRMTEDQAENHPGKNIISRALGAEPTVQIDLKTMLVTSDSTFLICSDGVTRHIGDAEITELLSSDDNPEVICSRIKDVCYERGAEDNLTAVIVRVATQNADEEAFTETASQTNTELIRIEDDEESTVATSRPVPAMMSEGDTDEDDLLEIDTAEFSIPADSTFDHDVFVINEPSVVSHRVAGIDEGETGSTDVETFHSTLTQQAEQDASDNVSGDIMADESEVEQDPALELATTESGDFPADSVGDSVSAETSSSSGQFSMFGNSGNDSVEHGPEASSGIFKVLSTVGLLLLGSVIGLGAYHYFLAPKLSTEPLPITEMKSNNIPLSSFEENRRNVDKDPAGYIAKMGTSPETCEDYYLIGRAYLLVGDAVKGRSALAEARSRITGADVVNAKTLATDIAVAMAITNDPAAQGVLKKELESSKPASNNIANANSNTGR